VTSYQKISVSDKRWSATAGEVAGFKSNRHGNALMVKMMGAGRLQAMQMQAASGSGNRQCNAYCTSMSPGTAASWTCQLDYIHTRVLRACPIRNMYFIISVVDQSASPRTKTETDGYHTLPAVLNNNNNNNSNPILSSRTTVVAWTHVIINPPHRDQAKAHGVCVSQASQASQRRSRQK
jgi:hypothetical protein